MAVGATMAEFRRVAGGRDDLIVNDCEDVRGSAFADSTSAVAKKCIIETASDRMTQHRRVVAPTRGFDARKW